MITPRVGVVCRGDSRRGAQAPFAESYLVAKDGRATWLDGAAEQREAVDGRGVLTVVADGEGEDAAIAQVAATSSVRSLIKIWPAGVSEEPGRLAEFLSSAHTRMYWHARDRAARMGASLAVGWVDGTRLGWAEVGSARVWLWRDGRMTRLGRDRDRLADQRFVGGSQGLGDDAAIHMHPGVNVGVAQLREGDQVLLATDGLWRWVDEPSAAQVLTHTDDPQASAVTCMERAVARGGTDHITVAVLDLRPPRVARPDAAAPPEPRALRKDPPPVRKPKP